MMFKLRKAVASVVAVCMILAMTGATLVGAEETKTPSLDLMLVVDDTVSMQRNDPNHIATVALQQFASQIPSQGSRVGMATYDDDIMTSQPVLEVDDEQDKEQLRQYAQNGLTQNGHYTDLPKALDYAVEQLQALPEGDSPQAIIAVSDGENDFATDADKAASDAALQQVMESGIRVYLIVINSGDTSRISEYMDGIAQGTGGQAYYVNSGDDIPDILSQITNQLYEYVVDDDSGFEDEVGVETPSDWNFNLEDGVFEAILELTHTGDLQMNLFREDGTEIPMTEENGIVSYAVQGNGEIKTIIKMLEPEAGSYDLKMQSVDVPQIVIGDIVLNREIYVQVDVSSAQVAPGEEFGVTASLMRGTEAYTDLAFSNLNARVTLDGQEVPMSNNSKGFDCNITAPETEGEYELTVTVQGKTFNRTSDPVTIQVGAGAAAVASSSSTSQPQTPDKGGFPLWLLGVLAAVVVIIVVVVILLKSRSRYKGTEYIRLQGNLFVTYYKSGHNFVKDSILRPGAYYSKRKPKVSLGTMLKEAVDWNIEVPPAFDNILIAGRMIGKRMEVEITSVPGADDPEEPVNMSLAVDTGMQEEDEYDSFEDTPTVTVRFADGSSVELSYTI